MQGRLGTVQGAVARAGERAVGRYHFKPYPSTCAVPAAPLRGANGALKGWQRGNSLQVIPFIIIYHHKRAQRNPW